LLAVYGESTVGIVELKLGELNEGHLLKVAQVRQIVGAGLMRRFNSVFILSS
jgi:hypothetical protein